jgi:hypothetical protein
MKFKCCSLITEDEESGSGSSEEDFNMCDCEMLCSVRQSETLKEAGEVFVSLERVNGSNFVFSKMITSILK